MTQEEKQLLLRDLCARLPYNVKVLFSYSDDTDDTEPTVKAFTLTEINTENGNHPYWIGGEQLRDSGFSNGTTSFAVNIDDDLQYIKPYLRPMSSMTEEETDEYRKISNTGCAGVIQYGYTPTQISVPSYEKIDWLNARHFDYRGLIGKGLALEALEGMYK